MTRGGSVRPFRLDKASIGRRLRIDQGERRGEVRHRASYITGPKISSRQMRMMAIARGEGPKTSVMVAPTRVVR